MCIIVLTCNFSVIRRDIYHCVKYTETLDTGLIVYLVIVVGLSTGVQGTFIKFH